MPFGRKNKIYDKIFLRVCSTVTCELVNGIKGILFLTPSVRHSDTGVCHNFSLMLHAKLIRLSQERQAKLSQSFD